jgi:HTH-type transcriptional regulator/antitoxin HigA
MTETTRIWPDVAIPPGEVLGETIEALGLTQAELARRMGRPSQTVNEIVRGSKEITPETALQLERVVGVPAHVWTRLDADYRFNKARLEDREQLEAEKERAAAFPYREMSKHGWVPRTRDRLEQTSELLKYFGVASLAMVKQFEEAAYRSARRRECSPEALAAWVRQGERVAQRVAADPFDAKTLRAAVPGFRALTRKRPEQFLPKLRERLAAMGVILVLVPHLPKTYAHGATFWVAKGRAVVQMSIHYRWDDVFWFSFFHELGHVLKHGKGSVFIERSDGSKSAREAEADAFASDSLIPPRLYERLVSQGPPFSRKLVLTFAEWLGVAPSIVVGRLQHERLVRYSHLNGLRSRFEWAKAGS